MRINRISVTDKLGKPHPTQVYEVNGRKLRVRYVHHKAPNLYFIDRNINATKEVTEYNGKRNVKPDWSARPDMDTYEIITRRFDFLIPSYSRYTDVKTGESVVKTGVSKSKGRGFLSSVEDVRSAMRDFNDNYEIWKKRVITKDLRDKVVCQHVTECLIYDEADWQKDPPQYATKEVDGVTRRVLFSPGTRPQPIARGISACALGETYQRKLGNAKAFGRALQHYAHKYGKDLEGNMTEQKNTLNIPEEVMAKLAQKTPQEIMDMLASK